MYRIENKDDDSDNASLELKTEDGSRSERNVFENESYKTTKNHDNNSFVLDGRKPTIPPLRIVATNIHKVAALNTRALSKESLTYELEKFEQNYMVIINQEEVDSFEETLDTQKDVNILKDTFKKMNFEILEVKNKTKKEILDVLAIFTHKNFTDYGCVAVVVLTRGDPNGYDIWAKDVTYNEEHILEYLKVDHETKSTLVTKPKIVLIQACGLVEVHTPPVIKKDALEGTESYSSPVSADILVVYSAYVNKQFTGDNVGGPWFIRAFCKEIEAMAGSKHILIVLNNIRREVTPDFQQDHQKDTVEVNRNKLTPRLTYTLTRDLYITKFGHSPQTTNAAQCKQCKYFPDHYSYMKGCLERFVQENPNDETAKGFLSISNQLGDLVVFNSAKEKMRLAICQHLVDNKDRCQFYKHIYFYDYPGIEKEHQD